MKVHDTRGMAQQVMDRARSLGVTFADMRISRVEQSHAQVQDRRADRLGRTVTLGAGLRVLVDEAWGFAGTEEVTLRSLDDILHKAVDVARASSRHVADKGGVASQKPIIAAERVRARIDPRSVGVREKMDRLVLLEKAALDHAGSVIVNSVLAYADGINDELLVNTVGTCIESEIIQCRLSCQLVASDGKIFQRSAKSWANRAGYEVAKDLDPERSSIAVAKAAVQQLTAKRPPAGTFPVVFHPNVTGLLMHEALGHSAEADGVWTGESILAGKKLGERIASEKMTVYDDATYPDSFGSYEYDSEGVPGGKRAIIERGVLKTWLHSLETAHKFGMTPNGCGRAQSFLYRPVVRMSNTYMARGTDPVADIFKGITRGVYLKEGSSGYVFVDKGQFVCNASQAQMIENGALGEPLRDVSVNGMMLETLMNIEAVADDFEMDSPGMCGKSGQSVPTNCGGPHVRVASLVVGGV